MQTRKIVLSGMRPTGALHLGHYHGALKNWVKLQQDHQCFYFVADWHALTTHYESPEVIEQHTHEMVLDWIASGLNPDQATLFVQSKIPEHAELFLLLCMMTPLSWLERVPTYKDQQEKLADKDLSTYGFLGYPLLQAADILIYGAHIVPVGEDQVPHLEFTREIARRFNHLYGGGTQEQKNMILQEPEAMLTQASKLPGLDGQKMSKSYGNTIALRDDAAAIEKKVKTMPTDPARIRRSDAGNPDNCPVWLFHEVYSNDETKAWVREGCTQAKIGCIECKSHISQSILKEQIVMLERIEPYQQRPDLIKDILSDGCAKAKQAAQHTLGKVKHAMGIR